MRGWLAALLLAAILPGAALAQGYVTCVQAQLAALGYGVGAGDGVLGPATLKASRAVQGDDLPALSERTAYDWCLLLSERDVTLRAHWPSVRNDVFVLPPALAGTPAETLSRNAHADARGFFLQNYGLELVGDFAFVVGDTAQSVESRAIKVRRQRGGTDTLGFATNPMPCGVDGGLRAIAFRDMALFCWGPDGAYDAAWLERHQVRYARSFVHEYAHGLQNELAGVHGRARLPGGGYVVGPSWLVEGAAETLEEEYYARVTRFKERSLGRQRKIILGNDTPLTALRRRVTLGSDYDVAQYAAFLLGERFGRAAFFDYFENVRSADSWDDAFRTTFNMSLDAYEREFQTLRTDLVAAYRFAKGE